MKTNSFFEVISKVSVADECLSVHDVVLIKVDPFKDTGFCNIANMLKRHILVKNHDLFLYFTYGQKCHPASTNNCL